MSTQTMPAGGDIPGFPLPDRLRRAREFRGLTQTDLAEALGVSRRTIASHEGGQGTLRRPLLLAWAMATGVNLHWLETGEAPSPGGGDGAPTDARPEGLEPPTSWSVVSAPSNVVPLRRVERQDEDEQEQAA